MPHSFFSDADPAVQMAAEQTRREQAEASLAEARAHIAALRQELATTASSAQRYHAQLTSFVQNLQAGLVLVDQEGQIQFVNQHFWELFGLSPVVGPTDGGPAISFASIAIDNLCRAPAAFAARAQELHQAGETVLREEFVLADGRTLELDYLVLDSMQAGRLICYRDVTERHQREAQLNMLSYIPEQNPNPTLRLSATGDVLYTNPAAAPLLQALAAAAPEDLQQGLLALVQAALLTPEQHQQELAVAGEYYLCTAVAVPGQQCVTLYLTNITARRQAEEQLRVQRAFYDRVLEQVPTAVAVFDARHRYLFLNPMVEPDPAIRAWMLGKTSEEAGAHRQRPVTIRRQRAAAFAEAVRDHQAVSWEEASLDPNGHMRNMLMHFSPVRGADGELLVISSGIDITDRKQAEEKMARQQEFYESILNLLPVEVAVFDASHHYLFVNPASIPDPAMRQQIIGLTNADYFMLSQPNELASLTEQREQYFALAVRSRTDVTWEEMHTDLNHRPQLMLRHLRPVFAANGALRLLVRSGIDITARYTAEKLQQQVQEMQQVQQAFVRQIVDALPNMLYVVATDGSISFANSAYRALNANSRHWETGEAADPLVREEMHQLTYLNEQVLATRLALTVELPFTMDSGETLHYQVHKRPLLRADGQVDVLTISTDVTAVKRTRQALERREKQYHDLVYYSQALICTHDLQGRLLSVNPAIEALMGQPAAQLLGHHLREALPPEHHAGLQGYLDGTLAAHLQNRVIRVQTTRGERRYLQYYSYQVTEDGYPPYVVASGYDVTTGVLAQRALQQAKQEAEENTQAKEAFLARMSHEIRTPLNGVLGMAAILQKTALDGPQREYLNTMQHAGRHLLALVNDVLDMAKITARHLELNHAPFDLAVALQGAGEAVAALAAQKGLQLVVEPLRTAAPRVTGDAYRLHQILLNLLSNAIKFTGHGRVRLGTDVLQDTPRELVLRFWVEDTGIGIAPEEQGHIFEAFAQASTETSRRFGGTGLGLAISQQLVEQMGGTLGLRSEPGRGTTFSFELRLPRAEAASAAPLVPPLSTCFERLRGLRVLLAEDNVVNQQIAIIVLENWGVQVVAVSNGLDALAQLQQQEFDAALLDIRMPGLSGVEVTAAIRANADPRRAFLPIIALTANAFEADRLGYLAAGMNACLTKPYEEADLGRLLLKLMPQE
ncbi:PAS domain S-box protein [Hymenobacter artigasi]|uniref:histidine kinase n=1 Tax=Hymenobacter artigasi TaxID=2719616 RepID=A0ABX1HNR9_9BACT|nr:PAS domain S-box protein [Hymenobacter artigasi]NKI91850.1 PAS domain S-box-containing protein [Hymenobacter artigasi]